MIGTRQMFVRFNIWVKDEQNEGLQTCLNPHVWRCAPQLPKNSVCVELFPQSELPSANRQPSSDVFVMSLPLLCLFYSCFSCDCSQETFLEKPQGTDFPCASGQQTESAFCWLQLCSSPWGLREEQHFRKTEGSWIEDEAHQEKKGKDNGWVRTPQNKVVEGGQRFQTPHVMHFQCWLLKLPLLLSSGHLQNSHISIIPKSFKNARPWGRHSFCLGFRWEPFSQRKETGHLERTPRPQ